MRETYNISSSLLPLCIFQFSPLKKIGWGDHNKGKNYTINLCQIPGVFKDVYVFMKCQGISRLLREFVNECKNMNFVSTGQILKFPP